MTNQFLKPQNQLSFHNYIEFRSLRFSILFKEQNLILKLRGGGNGTSSGYGVADPQIQHIKTKHNITLTDIIKLIQLNPNYCSVQQQNPIPIIAKNKQILNQIPKLISNYESIQNEMLSLLIFEQLGSVYQFEFENNINNIVSQGFQLEGLRYQYEIIKTAKQQKETIKQDKHFQTLLTLPHELQNRFQLIDSIKNIEMQLIFSEQSNYKEYSSLMIYKLQKIFEKLLQIFYNLNEDKVTKQGYLKSIFTDHIVNSQSIHIYNQWITLISNLYLIRPFEKSNQDKKKEIITKITKITKITNEKYLQFQIQEKQCIDNQVSIIKKKLKNNFKNYEQSEAIFPLLQHITMEQQNSDSQIVKLKNSYINIMIDRIRILISYNSFYNQCTLDKQFANEELQYFEKQFQEIEKIYRMNGKV